jgi:hypothetical protein
MHVISATSTFAKPDVAENGTGDPGGNRTRDNLIKSQVLYRLSYRIRQKRHLDGGQ